LGAETIMPAWKGDDVTFKIPVLGEGGGGEVETVIHHNGPLALARKCELRPDSLERGGGSRPPFPEGKRGSCPEAGGTKSDRR